MAQLGWLRGVFTILPPFPAASEGNQPPQKSLPPVTTSNSHPPLALDPTPKLLSHFASKSSPSLSCWLLLLSLKHLSVSPEMKIQTS